MDFFYLLLFAIFLLVMMGLVSALGSLGEAT